MDSVEYSVPVSNLGLTGHPEYPEHHIMLASGEAWSELPWPLASALCCPYLCPEETEIQELQCDIRALPEFQSQQHVRVAWSSINTGRKVAERKGNGPCHWRLHRIRRSNFGRSPTACAAATNGTSWEARFNPDVILREHQTREQG